MRDDTGDRRPNHLAGETSPYLLQHLHNPVDWWPWSEAALERARRENRPIFLSIGYAACHWCHVMERESFEDARIARLLNEHFVPIKVDREERPDLDEIYMNAVQLMAGHGGWPLNLFLTPGLEPFAGGTYFPPRSAHGRPGLLELLEHIRDAWRGRRDDIDRSARTLTEHLRAIARGALAAGTRGAPRVGRAETIRAAAELAARFDGLHGGFGAAPKFPPDGAIDLLLREQRRSGERVPRGMALGTLEGMALGGLYDHVGGGFARYSVDERWLVPHFEKMLYNQALLVPLYVDAWLVTGEPLHRRVVEQTLDFVRRELTAPEGGFLSSLDADSEGEEGRFYVWRPEEIAAVLGPEDGRRFCELYDVTAAGNFEGRSIPNLLGGSLAERARAAGEEEASFAARVESWRRRLLASRATRERPATDDKVLTAWNGLMIGACARAFEAFGRPEDLSSARRAAAFVLESLRENGRLRVTWRAGQARGDAFLDDHAFLGRGLVELYEADGEKRWLDEAAGLAATLVERFADEDGGFSFTAEDHERLLARSRSTHDGALPSGAGVAVELLLRLSGHLDEPAWRERAERALAAYRPAVERSPAAYAALLRAADWCEGPVDELAVVGRAGAADTEALLREIRSRYLPRRVLQPAEPGDAPGRRALLRGREVAPGGPATAWLCREGTCLAPVTDPEALARQLDG